MTTRTLPDAILLARRAELSAARRSLDQRIKSVEGAIADRGLDRTRRAQHGTDSGYYAHRRRWGTEPCAPCRRAHAAAEAARRLRSLS